jgi:hypothetical protein
MTTITANPKKMKAHFTPSVNILRDTDIALTYIPTPNSKKIFSQLINDYNIGIRSFNIVGAYGTGKSAFLWAFEKNINRKKEYFSPLSKSGFPGNGFEFFSFVGSYVSLMETFAKRLKISTKGDFKTEDIIDTVEQYYKSLHKAGKGLVIVLDEFGKFLEFAAKNNPENELYFIQQLAEYANDQKKNIFFITTLHQDFNGYSRNLTKTQQNEWDKVKGRLKEITFNEPVEQLLFLASERLKELAISEKDKNFKRLFKCIETSKAFPLKDYFNESFAEKLLPFDILSASVLTLSLQKYGQNERSLFSFIESNDQFGIKDFTLWKDPYYNLSKVYDYLIHNFYSFLTTRYNPHQAQWSAIRTAIERAELMKTNVSDAVKIVKTIGLLNIFASASAKLNVDFLNEYSKSSLGIKEPEKIIKALDGLKIIRFIKYSNKYILFEGTDLDIEVAIDEAGNLVEKVTNVVHHLNKYFDFPYIPAKAVYYEKGTPRFFQFHLSESPEKLHPEGEVDGFINLVFSDNLKKEKEIKEVSAECEEAVLYGWYGNTSEIKSLIFEIEKVKKVKETHSEDRVAVRELENILRHQIKLLNHYVLGNLYSSKSPVTWYFKGKKVDFDSQTVFNRFLSAMCGQIYSKTPIFKNEMVNKTNLSGAIITARKNFLGALIANWHEKDLHFDEKKFPPEKTIYLSLLRETGMHRLAKDGYILSEPTNKKVEFTPLWDACSTFLNSTRNGKRNLQELIDKLSSKPFKLKEGLIEFWLPLFLFCKRDDFALFNEDGYIPYLTLETLELVSKDPKEFEIKAFDIEGVKLNLFNSYRTLLNQSQQKSPTGQTFIETIRPFLTFYRQLPEYSKKTEKLEKRTLALRQAIALSKDPEDTFFVQFPKALGYSIPQLQNNKKELEAYSELLQASIKEIRTCYNGLIDRIEQFIQQEITGNKPFPEYKNELQERLGKVKKHLLLPHQKVFYQRLFSETEDNKGWISSIAQACIGKPLEEISDEEEYILMERLKDIVHELDNLCEISKSGFDENKEIAFKLEVTSFVEGLKKNLVRLPKSKNRELIQLHSVVKAKLSGDKQLNIATLAKLLEELLKNDK